MITCLQHGHNDQEGRVIHKRNKIDDADALENLDPALRNETGNA